MNVDLSNPWHKVEVGDKAPDEDYKKLEHKIVEVEDFQGAQKAKEIIKQSLVDYQHLIKEN